MTRNLLSSLILWIVCSILVFFCFVIVASAQEDSIRPAHIGFVFPISSNGSEAAKYNNGFSFHVLAGVSRGEQSFCFSGISSLVKENTTGVMISGLYNHTGNTLRGFQLAGLANVVGVRSEGLQLSGLVNITDSMTGVQVSGFANIARYNSGLQLAGFINQSAGAAVQIAGFANVSHRSKALQLSGFINVAHDVRSQVSGFINIAHKVKGVQVAGFINIAAESDYPIGLINIIKNGEQQLGLSIDETGGTLLAFRSGGKVLYGIVGAGYNFKDDNARYVLEGGLGVHFPCNKYFRINLEATTGVLSDLQYDVYMKSTTRLLAAFKIANRIEIFAGPSFNHLGYERGQTDIRNDHYLWRERGFDHFNGLYLGATGGVQVNL